MTRISGEEGEGEEKVEEEEGEEEKGEEEEREVGVELGEGEEEEKGDEEEGEEGREGGEGEGLQRYWMLRGPETWRAEAMIEAISRSLAEIWGGTD
jgi:hypothetical protein